MNVSRRAGRIGRGIAAVLLVVLCTSMASAQVLDQIPSDALVVFKINHLQDTSTKLAGLFQALGITDFVPSLSDPLGAMQNQMQLTSGLDKSGDAAIVMLNGDWADIAPGHDANGNETPAAHKPPLLILVPVSDYKAFLTNMDITNTQDDITQGHFKNQDKSEDEIYVANWGSFAACSPDRDSLTKKPDGLKVAGLAARELSEKDMVAYANIASCRAKLLPLLQSNREKIMSGVDTMVRAMRNAQQANQPNAGDNGAATDTGATPTLKAVVNRGIDVAQELLQDGQAATWGFAISKAGLNGTILGEFAQDSYWGKTVHQMPQTDQPLLGGLPAGKYMFYAGGIADPKVAGDVYDHITGPFLKDISTTGGADADTVKNALSNYRDVLTSTSSTAVGMVAPTGAIGQGGLIQLVAVYKGDAAKLKDAQEKQMQSQQDLMRTLGSAQSADQVKITVTPNAKTVDGVQFDQLLTTFNMGNNTPQGMQAQQFLNILYGPGGLSMYSGVIDPKTLLLITGGNDQLMTDSIASAKSGADVLTSTDPMKAVDAELPKNRAVAVYIPLDVIVSTAVSYARQFGFAMPIQIPPNLPPIGFTLGEEGSAIRVDGHVPTELVQSLVQAGMQVYLQLHGGGANQNGGGGL